MPTAIDHDQIFKRLIEAFFREFMELFCPDEARVIDFGRVEFLREEHFTDVPEGTRRRLDLVAKVGLKTGSEKFVLVHGEFEASRKERDFPRRMFRLAPAGGPRRQVGRRPALVNRKVLRSRFSKTLSRVAESVPLS